MGLDFFEKERIDRNSESESDVGKAGFFGQCNNY